MYNTSTEATPAYNTTLLSQTTLTLLNLTEPNGRDVDADPGLLGRCDMWSEAQHTIFQLANICMAVSFLTPSGIQYHAFFLRTLLLLAFLFFLIWAGLVVCMLDILVWNGVFVMVDVGHIVYLAYLHFPVKMHDHMEDVYSKLFKPLRMTRKEFAMLIDLGTVMTVSKGSLYAVEGISPIGERVAVLVRGRLKVTYGKFYLHHIEANEFVDSPEFDTTVPMVEHDDKYQVTISAAEESRILMWNYARLVDFLDQEQSLSSIFHYAIGKDVSHKLYQIQELLLVNPDYMRTLASRQSSMVNLRNSLVTHDSCLNLPVLSSSHMSGGLTIASVGAALAKKAKKQETFETSV